LIRALNFSLSKSIVFNTIPAEDLDDLSRSMLSDALRGELQVLFWHLLVFESDLPIFFLFLPLSTTSSAFSSPRSAFETTSLAWSGSDLLSQKGWHSVLSFLVASFPA